MHSEWEAVLSLKPLLNVLNVHFHRSLTWEHGVNSKEKLRAALARNVDMLEADLMYSDGDRKV